MNRFWLLLFSTMFGCLAQSQVDELFVKTDDFMDKYVVDGKVDYMRIKAEPSILNDVVNSIEQKDISSWDKNEQLAFWINAYNLTTINAIVSAYPIGSPMEIAGFFDTKKHLIAGEKLTLNDLENKKIREPYNDPRIHFVLVCAANGCPKISPKAYMPSTVYQQLEEQTTAAMNDNAFIQVKSDERKVLISEIFRWYSKDFESANLSYVEYINKYRASQIPADYRVDFYTYDWSLNEKKKP